jgi:Ca2+-binding RTX toxin-like protein
VVAPPDPCALKTCNGHGWCDQGSCVCDPGYGDTDCTACADGWVAQAGCRPPNAIDGSAADQTIDGTSGDDHVRGLDGDDHVRGLDGSDFVNGNAGADFVNGNMGPDEVHGGAGDDEVHGGAGDDVVFGGDGDDVVYGGGGVDRLVGGDGNDTIDGGDGDDRYVIDGLGHDVFDDLSGQDAARCLPGVTIVDDQIENGDRVLTLSTGGSVRIVAGSIEMVLGCN